jgi:hypothetical protein
MRYLRPLAYKTGKVFLGASSRLTVFLKRQAKAWTPDSAAKIPGANPSGVGSILKAGG